MESAGARDAPERRTPSRRRLLRGAGAVAALGVVGAGGYTLREVIAPPADPRTVVPLYSQTVAYSTESSRMLVQADAGDSALHPGSRLLATLPEQSAPAERSRQFWQRTATWRAGVDEAFSDAPLLHDLALTSLHDLWVLTDDLPAPVAGWSTNWRYVWPRDAAFCAVALAHIGEVERAVGVLEHLQTLQGSDGWFEARYVPGTDRAPDDRARQFDGTGLLLWAAAEVAGAEAARTAGVGGSTAGAAPGRRKEILERLAPLITTGQRTLLAETEQGSSMPPVSPDYWEVREHGVTLGIMASTLAGLRAAASLTQDEPVQAAADAFAEQLTSTFGAHGFQRYRRRGGPDSALAFLDATGCHGIVPTQQLRALREDLARPAGGIAPGASWREDGISWTPSTSLLALALARAGEGEAAREVLTWLAEHRTDAGSLPEKVLFDGRPAAVAPLAWTAANVLLALDALSRA